MTRRRDDNRTDFLRGYANKRARMTPEGGGFLVEMQGYVDNRRVYQPGLISPLARNRRAGSV